MWLLLAVVSLAFALQPATELRVPWRAKVETSMALQRELSELACAKRAARMLVERRHEANEVNVCAMLYRLAGCRDESLAEEVGLLVAAAKEVAPRMKSRQLANSARALALCSNLSSSASHAAVAILDRIAAEANTWMRAEEVAMASWACARFLATEDSVLEASSRRALGALGRRAAVVTPNAYKEAATVAWALAKASPKTTDELDGAMEFLRSACRFERASPRDAATLAWASAKLGEGDWRLVAEARPALEAALRRARERDFFDKAAIRDVSQLASALATAAYDAPDIFKAVHQFIGSRNDVELGDASAILWASAVLDRPPEPRVFESLLRPVFLCESAGALEISLSVWAAAVLAYASPAHSDLAARALQAVRLDSLRKPEDFRRIHHALLALQIELEPQRFEALRDSLDSHARAEARANWASDGTKYRLRASSARHRAVADTLRALKAQHKVVATVSDEYGDLYVDMLVKLPGKSRLVALEFDGPSHFCSNDPRRPLGHTRLKRRLLAARGFNVVSIPYLDWYALLPCGLITHIIFRLCRDAIPYWSTMERQRYLQRKLRITETLRYQGGDKSYYAAFPPEAHKLSRLD